MARGAVVIVHRTVAEVRGGWACCFGEGRKEVVAVVAVVCRKGEAVVCTGEGRMLVELHQVPLQE